MTRALALRRSSTALRRADFPYGRCDTDDAAPDIAWLDTGARELGEVDFHTHRRTLIVACRTPPALLLVLQAGDAPADVVLPAAFSDEAWIAVLDTATRDGAPSFTACPGARSTITVSAHSFLAFRSA